MTAPHSNSQVELAAPANGPLRERRVQQERSFKFIGLALLVSTLLVGLLFLLPRFPAGFALRHLDSLRPGIAVESIRSPDAAARRSSGGRGGAASGSVGSGQVPSGRQQPMQQPAPRPGPSQQQQQQQKQQQQPEPPEERAVTSWAEGAAFHAPESRCTIQTDGSVTYDPTPSPTSGMPFLFDVNQFASKAFRERTCGAGIDDSWRGRYNCFGPCIFESRLCDTQFPGTNKSQAVLARYQAQGWRFGDLSPCELFQRIRGRTLWFMGDSQTCHFYHSAECFLREFAPRMNRSTPFPRDLNRQFNSHDPPIYPKCLELAHGTRVCQLRVDDGRTLVGHVLPLMVKHHPGFARDLVLFNFGLHYGKLGDHGFLQDIASVARWRRQRGRSRRPRMVWMDVPAQHFNGPDGRYRKSLRKGGPMQCYNLTAWYEGVPGVVAGGKKNMLASPHVLEMADAHLRTWNASVPLWDVHMPGECTHWCSPTAYHIWLWLLNRELGESRVGAPVQLRQRAGSGGSGA